MVLGRKIAIKLPKNEADTRFILGLRYSHWEKIQFCWVVPNYPGNLDLIKDYFKERIRELTIDDEIETTVKSNAKRVTGKNDLLLIKTTSGRLKIIFGYNKSNALNIQSHLGTRIQKLFGRFCLPCKRFASGRLPLINLLLFERFSSFHL